MNMRENGYPFHMRMISFINPHRLSLDITEKYENIRRLRYKRDIVVVLPFGIRSFQVCCLQSILHSINTLALR